MKKIVTVLCFILFVGLCCGCLSSNIYNTPSETPTNTPCPTTTPTPIHFEFISWDDIVGKYPVVTHEDIENGDCKGEYVLVEYFVDKVNEITHSGRIITTLYDSWYINDNGNVCEDFYFSFPWNDMPYVFHAKNGDKVLALCYVENTYPDIIYAITYRYHKNCQQMTDEIYISILRNPDNYLFTQYKICGKVIQILEETEDVFELIIKTENGDCFLVEYCRDSKERILLNDSIEIEGTFRGMETYKTLIGNNTAPSILSYELNIIE